MAVEAANVPVPHFLKSFRNFDNFAFLKFAIQVCGSGSAAIRNVI